ncbi:MAG: hypothetical protein HC851_21800 [Acaryochloris sp. RU_4_1]|nr:hypothetical protein [Acaryochloris sp. RU_4_1]
MPSKTTMQLIQALESGAIDQTEAARRIAQVHTAKSENYAQTLIAGLVLAGVAWAITGGSIIIPAAIAYLTLDSYSTQRKTRLQTFQNIAQGKILEYLPDKERELFTELEAQTLIQPGIQNPEDQGNARAQPETQTAQATQATITQDIATHFLENLRCTFLCAPPRTGKGIVAAAMMLGFKAQFPGAWLGSCTIKQFQGERWYWTSSDRHINPSTESGACLLTAAKEIYNLYQQWIATPSQPVKPSLLVIDELRDTLLRLKGLTMGEVAPDYPNGGKGFPDWLRDELVSAATMNQCHHRYVLLIAPVNTATGLTFPNANALQSYAAYVLVTPEEMAFTRAGNSAFSAPAIAVDDARFGGWHGLGWSTKGSQWLGVPLLGQDDLAHLEAASLPRSTWVPSPELGSKSGSTSNQSSTSVLTVERQEPRAIEQALNPTVLGSVLPGSDDEPTPNRAHVARELNRKGWPQTEILTLLWGVKRGGSKRYKEALEEYRAIVSDSEDC